MKSCIQWLLPFKYESNYLLSFLKTVAFLLTVESCGDTVMDI